MPKAKKLAVSHGQGSSHGRGKAASRIDRLRAATLAATVKPGPTCQVCCMGPDVTGFVAEMRARVPAVSYAAIVKGLASEGIRMTRFPLERHVRDGHGA